MEICRSCGADGTIEQYRRRHPHALSCCPERDPIEVNVGDLIERVIRLERLMNHLCPDKSDDI